MEWNSFVLNEALPISEIVSADGQIEYEDIEEYNEYKEEPLEDASLYSPESPLAWKIGNLKTLL